MNPPAGEPRPVVSGALVRAHAYVAFLGFVIPLGFALILAAKFVWPDFLGSVPWLQFGRIRVFHTNGVIYGWLSTAFLSILYYVIPKLAGRPLLSERLAWWTFWVWNLGLVLGLGAILAGQMQGIEYAEFPPLADVVFAAGFVMALVNLLGTIFASPEKQLYVSSWYFILGFAFTALNYVMANIVPTFLAPGAAGAAITGLWIHNAVGLWITPIGVGLVYFFLPVLLKRPIYSHALSLVGFWTLSFFYPLGGAHHFFFSPIPWWLQVLAVPLTVVLFAVVATVIYNWLATLKGEWKQVPGNMALRYLATGIIAYFATCTQGPFHTFFSVQKVIHFTDWVVAHAHLALLGAFTYFNLAAFTYIWPRVTGKEFYSKKLAESAYWMVTIGFYVFYFLPLTALGLVEGYLWMSPAPFAESVIQAIPFWFSRLIGGVLIYGGLCAFAYNCWMTHRAGARAPAAVLEEAEAAGVAI
ncbi:MAG: cbb3-type cytochrome c oxidase subunit I [Candidatus Tectomicrobia bacterium]|uniref:Cbb3-type cytochrome c oxidase subunit I n=1 Tax=Tectimicrobiota bacterium TaxID=2528274 RepID=A0A932GRK0_UNCTE|nr:cbb3-type cytochrome c oxidase subunit I [Candidatus Tectomicrobia bacterium]